MNILILINQCLDNYYQTKTKMNSDSAQCFVHRICAMQCFRLLYLCYAMLCYAALPPTVHSKYVCYAMQCCRLLYLYSSFYSPAQSDPKNLQPRFSTGTAGTARIQAVWYGDEWNEVMDGIELCSCVASSYHTNQYYYAGSRLLGPLLCPLSQVATAPRTSWGPIVDTWQHQCTIGQLQDRCRVVQAGMPVQACCNCAPAAALHPLWHCKHVYFPFKF
jgi:hypothetical protein